MRNGWCNEHLEETIKNCYMSPPGGERTTEFRKIHGGSRRPARDIEQRRADLEKRLEKDSRPVDANRRSLKP